MTARGVVLLFTCVAAALGSPCTTAPHSSYLSAGFACTISPQPTFTFSDFAFSAMVTGGAPTLLDANGITVTPTNTTANSLALAFSSSGFSVDAGQSVQYVISYLVDPPPPEIIHFNLALTPDPPTPAGLAQVSTQLCVGAAFANDSCPSTTESLIVYTNGTLSVLNDTVDFSGTVATLGVMDTITLNGGSSPSDPASFLSYEDTTITDLPEPASGLLGMIGVTLILLLVRCMRTELS